MVFSFKLVCSLWNVINYIEGMNMHTHTHIWLFLISYKQTDVKNALLLCAGLPRDPCWSLKSTLDFWKETRKPTNAQIVFCSVSIKWHKILPAQPLNIEWISARRKIWGNYVIICKWLILLNSKHNDFTLC